MDAKKLIAGGMAVFVLAGNALGIPMQAAAAGLETGMYADIVDEDKTKQDQENPMMPVSHMQTSFYLDEELAYKNNALSVRNVQAVSTYDLAVSHWAGSGGDYYFSRLNTAEKKLYLSLKRHADYYLSGTDTFQVTDVNRDGKKVQVHAFPLISYSGLSTGQMKKVFYCFMFENPQYYFMRNSVLYSETNSTMTVGLYSIFADGEERAAYTAQFLEKLESWQEQADALESIAEKEQLIHDFVCGYVDYNYNMITDDPDDKEMSQSCISAVLFGNSTVCAGYAQLFSLLCNRAGIDCITVTSAGHAWNKVRMGGVWYNVDCTWDDCRDDDTFLNIPDGQLLAADSALQEHVPSPEWEGLLPECTQPFSKESAEGAGAGPNVAAPGKTVETLSLNVEPGRITASFGPLEGCDGYTVQYASNGAMMEAGKKDIEETSYVITGIGSGQDCYVRVRPYVLDSKGGKLYGPFSKKVKAVAL